MVRQNSDAIEYLCQIIPFDLSVAINVYVGKVGRNVAASDIGSVFCHYPPTPNAPSNSWTLNYSIIGITWPTVTSCNAARLPVTSLPWPLNTPTVKHAWASQELTVAASERNVAPPASTFTTLDLYSTTVIWITPNTTAAPVWVTTSPAVSYTANYGTNMQNVPLHWQPDYDPTLYSYEVCRDIQEVPISPMPPRSTFWIGTKCLLGNIHTGF